MSEDRERIFGLIERNLAIAEQNTALLKELLGQGDEEWITTDEAMKILGVSRPTILRYIKNGRVVGHMVSPRKHYILKASLHEDRSQTS